MRWDPDEVTLRDLDAPIPWDRVWFTIAITVAYLGSMWFAHEAGRAREAELAIQSYATAEYHRHLTLDLLRQAERTMYVISETDSVLHERIRREVPGWSMADLVDDR